MAKTAACFHGLRRRRSRGLVAAVALATATASAGPAGASPTPVGPDPETPTGSSGPATGGLGPNGWNRCAAARQRSERHIRGPAGRLFVLWVPRAPQAPDRGAVVLAHGAGSPGSATWDLTPDSHSALRTLACAGFDAYAFDARGFGGSDGPAAMEGSAEGEPLVRAEEAARDLAAVVAFARAESGVERVHLVGWSWGCVMAGTYAGREPDQVRRLALFAPVYDRQLASRHVTDRRWREESKALHRKLHAPSRESKAVHRAFVQALFRFTDRDVLRIPNGAYRDLYGPDAPVWDPGRIRAPTLVIRGGQDRASRRGPALRLLDALTRAPHRRYVELAGAGHFAFRRHPHRQLYAELVVFLAGPP
jgi:pimeloyl-ACP methyl ester carboxylesterase